MTWDVRIAAADAKYGFVFNRRGLIPEQGALWAVPRLVGVSRCIDLLLSGRHFTGQEAYERGLVTQVLPAEEVLPAALATAREIAAAHPVSVGLTKELLHRFQTEPDREAAYDQELQAFLWMTRQDDAAEGGRAYLEKRPPQWKASKNGPYPPVAGQEPALGNDSADHPPHR
jgi:enoyl-CoA hydratase/carnithine racemase